jgi:hypothetical protein
MVPDGGSLAGGVVASAAWFGRYDPGGVVDHAGAVQDEGGSVRGLALAGDGTVVAVGHAEGPRDRDAWVAAFDLDGGELWSRTNDANLDDEAFAVTVTDATAYVAGYRDDAIWVAAYGL